MGNDVSNADRGRKAACNGRYRGVHAIHRNALSCPLLPKTEPTWNRLKKEGLLTGNVPLCQCWEMVLR
jgi:hypothetical protein